MNSIIFDSVESWNFFSNSKKRELKENFDFIAWKNKTGNYYVVESTGLYSDGFELHKDCVSKEIFK